MLSIYTYSNSVVRKDESEIHSVRLLKLLNSCTSVATTLATISEDFETDCRETTSEDLSLHQMTSRRTVERLHQRTCAYIRGLRDWLEINQRTCAYIRVLRDGLSWDYIRGLATTSEDFETSVAFETDQSLWCDWTRQSDWTGLLFFRVRCSSFRIHSHLLTFFLCFIVLFQSCCSHAQVFRRTLVHEFPFYIAILNGTCSLSCAITVKTFWKWSVIKQTSKTNNIHWLPPSTTGGSNVKPGDTYTIIQHTPLSPHTCHLRFDFLELRPFYSLSQSRHVTASHPFQAITTRAWEGGPK